MLVFLDTNIWIYAYENDPVFGVSAQRFLQSLRSGNHRMASSLFVLSELLVLPTRRGNAFALASYKRLFSSPELTLLSYDMAAVQAYAQLRALHRLKPLDALHLATAAAARVDLFVTQDTNLLPRTSLESARSPTFRPRCHSIRWRTAHSSRLHRDQWAPGRRISCIRIPMRLQHVLLALTLALPGAAAAPAQVPAGPTTRVLAISHYTPGTDISAVLPVLKEEVPATLRLYLGGKIDQWYYRTDQKGVVFILNCTSVEEARALLEKLPLGRHHYMEFDYIALGPLTPLGALLITSPKD